MVASRPQSGGICYGIVTMFQYFVRKITIFTLYSVLVFWSVETFATSRETRVLISADTATGLIGGWRGGADDVDDGFAIGMALHAPSLRVLGIGVVRGNSDMAPQYLVTKNILDMLGDDTPIWRGAAHPYSSQVEWFGASEGEFKLSELPQVCSTEAVRQMAEQLTQPTTLIAIGPLTDIACLAQKYPERAKNIENIVSIMGRKPYEMFNIMGNSGLTDFNYNQDPGAVAALLEETEIKMTFMTFSMTSDAFVSAKRLETLKDAKSKVANFFYEASQPWIEKWKAIFGTDGFHPWDQNTVYYVMDPAAYACFDVGYCVVKRGADGSGDPSVCFSGDVQAKPAAIPAGEASQLWLSADFTTRQVTMCSSYSGDKGKQAFLKALFTFLE